MEKDVDKVFDLRDEKIRLLQKELVRLRIEAKDKINHLSSEVEFLLMERDELLDWKIKMQNSKPKTITKTLPCSKCEDLKRKNIEPEYYNNGRLKRKVQ